MSKNNEDVSTDNDVTPQELPDLVDMIRRLDQKMTYLEKKIDTLIHASQQKQETRREEKPFWDKPFKKFKKSFDRSRHGDRQERPYRGERQDQPYRGNREDRPYRGDRQNRPYSSDRQKRSYGRPDSGNFRGQRPYDQPWKENRQDFGGKKRRKRSEGE